MSVSNIASTLYESLVRLLHDRVQRRHEEHAQDRGHEQAGENCGAEIGISTDKLHARGPWLEELTTYKYVIRGEEQVP